MNKIEVGTQIVVEDTTFVVGGIFWFYGDKALLLISNNKDFTKRHFDGALDFYLKNYMARSLKYTFIDDKVEKDKITIWVAKNQLLGLIPQQADGNMNAFFPLFFDELEGGKAYDALYKDKVVKVRINRKKTKGMFVENKQIFDLENYYVMNRIVFLR